MPDAECQHSFAVSVDNGKLKMVCQKPGCTAILASGNSFQYAIDEESIPETHKTIKVSGTGSTPLMIGMAITQDDPPTKKKLGEMYTGISMGSSAKPAQAHNVFYDGGVEFARVSPDGWLLLGGTTPESAPVAINVHTGRVKLNKPVVGAAKLFWETVAKLVVMNPEMLPAAQQANEKPAPLNPLPPSEELPPEPGVEDSRIKAIIM